jgi:membrane protease YdiL (CAAX protease family)
MSAVLLYPHLLAISFVVVMPVLGYFRNRRAQAELQAGDPLAKVRLLRGLVMKQAIYSSLVLGLLVFGGVPARALGICAPPSWGLTVGLTAAAAAFFIISGLRLRAKSATLRQKLAGRAGALMPESLTERRWFAAVCCFGGLFEELAFRGFLFYYLTLLFPAINGVEKVLVTSVLFGTGHLYQGKKGMLATGLAGLVMGFLYFAGGNLLLPVVSHILANLRVLLIFPAQPPETGVGEVKGRAHA